MAVYTFVSSEEIINFFKEYDLDTLGLSSFQAAKPIQAGIENSNYVIEFDREPKAILTIYEKRTDPKDLPFFFAYMDHLRGKEINCPVAYKNRNGSSVGLIKGKSASLISFLSGAGLNKADITTELCFELGQFVARMHEAVKDFPLKKDNKMGFLAWVDLIAKIGALAQNADPNLPSLLEEELALIDSIRLRNDFQSLPQGVVHADLFPDNVFAINGHITGVIDFYFSCSDYLTYDLALVFNAWCFDEDANLKPEWSQALLSGYQSLRPLTDLEQKYFSWMLRAAALRILLTRLYDSIFQDPSALVTVKDPIEYLKILQTHRMQKQPL
jgi:homoserine kinase type II